MWNSTLSVNLLLNKEQEETVSFHIKIDKVGKLVEFAKITQIYYDGLFDDLMDKYEQSQDVFDYVFDVISLMIQRHNPVDIIERKFLQLLKIKSMNQLVTYTWF